MNYIPFERKKPNNTIASPKDLEKILFEGTTIRLLPNGEPLVSVSTFLSHSKHPDDVARLEAWKQRVGVDEAAKISEAAKTNGKETHALFEECMRLGTIGDDPVWLKSLMNRLRPHNLKKIIAIEEFLISRNSRLYGYPDYIFLDEDGNYVVFDLKTSKKFKQKEWIEDYVMQCLCYSFMVVEEYNQPMPKKVIIGVRVGESSDQLFSFAVKEYLPSFRERYKRFQQTALFSEMRRIANEGSDLHHSAKCS